MKKMIILTVLAILAAGCLKKPEKKEYMVLHPGWENGLKLSDYMTRTDSVLADIQYRLDAIDFPVPPPKQNYMILYPGWNANIPPDKIIEVFAIKTDSILAELDYQAALLEYLYKAKR